uniref:CCHC-type domain-containing protein n=1 Tax=Tanacetum cinerariifolium TaxID=118510 RepID=A0A6L2MIE6_TANCI|nr:hypothetical protein [Tanacetum cinerariifolium]
MQNTKDISDPITTIDMTLAPIAKAFTLNNTTLTNNKQRSLSNPSNMQIAKPGMNMDQDRQMLMVKDNIVENMNGLSVVSEIENQYGNRNIVTAPAEGNGNGINGNPIRCYNCRGEGHYIAQEEEVRIQSTQDEFKFMAATDAYKETKRVKANCNLENNLQEALTSGTQSDKAPVYDSDRSAEHVVKQRMTLDIHNWSSSAHQEIHKIIKDEILPIVNQVDARVQNFKMQFLKEAAKFVRDFKSPAKEADESLVKHEVLELEIEHLLRAVVSQDIMFVVQNNSVEDTSNLQTKLNRTKERFENYIIKKENEYDKLWNDWYKKCEECKYDRILYDKAYNDMQQKIERLQAQLGDLKGKSKDTSCVSNTLNPLPQKLENENVELEFQVWNYKKENAHLKTAYKNLFDSINVIRTMLGIKLMELNTARLKF